MKEEISVMYSEEVLNKKIGEMAEQISKDYEGKSIHLICILKGSIFFCCELAKRLTVPVTIDFMSASSYGNETKSTGKLKINKDLDEEIDGLHCLIVEDIIDSGNTLSMTKKMLEGRNPASLKLKKDCLAGIGTKQTPQTVKSHEYTASELPGVPEVSWQYESEGCFPSLYQ